MATFLGIDVGTSSVKALLVDDRQKVLASTSVGLEVQRPHPLWSEQDPHAWWAATEAAVGTIRNLNPTAFAMLEGIGLSGQQHGATLLDRAGAVLRPCILWNDGRASEECRELLRRVPDFTQRASNIPMPGFTSPKLLWVARNEPDVFARVDKVLLPKDYVRYRMSGAYVSDMSDSAGTLWMDVPRRGWDDVLIEACGLTRHAMPDLVEGLSASAALSPEVARAWGLGERAVPIAGGAGDNVASAVGIGATGAGEGFISLGTSGVVFVTTDRPVALPDRTLHAFCHAFPGRWHGMAVTLSAAQSLSWLASLAGRTDDVAGLLAGAQAYCANPRQVASAPLFLPYLTGERTPHNDPDATAHFARLRVDHGIDALTYAVLEGVAFALSDCLHVLKEAGASPHACTLVGGGSRSGLWGQIIADATGLHLDVARESEHGAALGAARLGMLAAGGSEDEVCVKPEIASRLSPGFLDPALLEERRAAVFRLYER